MNPYSKVMINKKIKLIKNHQINNLMINKNKLVKMINKEEIIYKSKLIEKTINMKI
jgi:hypothetical protein